MDVDHNYHNHTRLPGGAHTRTCLSAAARRSAARSLTLGLRGSPASGLTGGMVGPASVAAEDSSSFARASGVDRVDRSVALIG